MIDTEYIGSLVY